MDSDPPKFMATWNLEARPYGEEASLQMEVCGRSPEEIIVEEGRTYVRGLTSLEESRGRNRQRRRKKPHEGGSREQGGRVYKPRDARSPRKPPAERHRLPQSLRTAPTLWNFDFGLPAPRAESEHNPVVPSHPARGTGAPQNYCGSVLGQFAVNRVK